MSVRARLSKGKLGRAVSGVLDIGVKICSYSFARRTHRVLQGTKRLRSRRSLPPGDPSPLDVPPGGGNGLPCLPARMAFPKNDPDLAHRCRVRGVVCLAEPTRPDAPPASPRDRPTSSLAMTGRTRRVRSLVDPAGRQTTQHRSDTQPLMALSDVVNTGLPRREQLGEIGVHAERRHLQRLRRALGIYRPDLSFTPVRPRASLSTPVVRESGLPVPRE